ncbi:MAG: methylmalonyl-CoA mutase family protein [Nocardioides sp.]
MTDVLHLEQPEDAHSQAEWEAATAAVLRKARRLTDSDPDDAVWAKLTRRTLDGIEMPPLGLASERLDPDAVRPTRAGAWDIRSLVALAEPKAANETVLAELAGGATSIWLHADADTDIEATLAGVFCDLAPVVLDSPTAALASAEALIETAIDGLHPATNFGFDPLGAMLRDIPLAVDEAVAELQAVGGLADSHGVRGIVVDATAAHDLGASDVQELGWSIAVGAAYLRWLVDHGLDVVAAAGVMEFRYAATDDQFATIAKLRAARQIWARVLRASGAEAPMAVHAVTSRPMLSKYDPHTNMLRATVAAFAAGVGGADAVSVLPFDSSLGMPSDLGRRIARNLNHLLIDESHVAVVADPAGGAYAVERLTADLAAAGWAAFTELEGEWTGANQTGSHDFSAFVARVEATVQARDAQIATRRRPITGLSEFPNLAETLPQRAPDPLNDAVRRYGAPFERLRDEPAPTRVFLATMGPVAAHTARATFASNLFAAGGVGVDVAGATTGPDDLVAAWSGQPVVCLAGADAAYAEWGQAAATALRQAGATRVVIAGAATDYADDNCAMGVHALDFLARTRAAGLMEP